MKRVGRIIVGLMMWATAFPAFGQSAPEGFRDLKWGATREQVSLAFPSANCETKRSESVDWTCTARDEKVNDVSVMIIIGGYTTGKVVGMSGFTSHSRKPCPLGREESNPCRGIIKGAGGPLYPTPWLPRGFMTESSHDLAGE